ncbi:TrmH family RNA methyltransferase [Zhouia sp. PK063]|uniref:TrmH family RNA methyltransferase n=1 Tax=Zhouia sp. PK063 TaxID=3373602 RepID=UPI0037AFE261
MVSKSELKLITSLQQKKYRNKYQLFVVEGIKGVQEILNSSFTLHKLFCTENHLFDVKPEHFQLISEKDLQKMSSLSSPNKVLAVFKIPHEKNINLNGLTIALDDVRDPGNLGTIIRLCDWFGIENLICSDATVDCYNPKVVQATMGSLTRVNIMYTHLVSFLQKQNTSIFIADMNGENVYHTALPQEAILVMGNEANGISDEIFKCATHKISIPRFGEVQQTESLNVATATAILVSEFKRVIK